MAWGGTGAQRGAAQTPGSELIAGVSDAALRSDVLVVGAGSAGSVVAERLSVDSACSVTVLEAGVGLADPALRALTADGLHLPIGADSPLVQRYSTQLTEQADNPATIVRGATIGGSGAVNGGYFCRGLADDFDTDDIPGWAWSDVLDHFRAIETDLDFSGPAHGDCGPIKVSRTSEFVGSTEAFVAAAERAGVGWISDLNDAGPTLPTGVGAVPLNVVDGVRTGAGAGFLLPALDRPNLSVLTRTKVVRIRIDSNRAVGVEAIGPDGPIMASADRIVVCAGAIESAHLLMLSGVGDEAMLRAGGVDVVAALPVGLACTDHPEWLVPVNWPTATSRPVLEVVLSTGEGVEIRPYTAGFAAMVGERGRSGADWPHIGVALMRPRTRGRITLIGAEPELPPRIEHRYDREADDVAVLRRGAELARELAATAESVGSPIWSTSQHLCGSAPMGGEHDPGAVVDQRCRVRGIAGLWVIDGSVLPTIPSRGPHATIVMLAHRAAEFVSAG